MEAHLNNGAILEYNDKVIKGWACSHEHDEPVTVTVAINGQPSGETTASEYIEGLSENSPYPTGNCGFTFELPANLPDHEELEVRVYIGKKQDELIQSPVYLFSEQKKDKIFYLHIPKAAGSSLNSILKDKFEGKHNFFRKLPFWHKKSPQVAVEHIESVAKERYRELNTTHKMISGHVKLSDIRIFFHLQNFLRVTVLREPTSHVISHLTWVRNLSSEENLHILKHHNPIIQDISRELQRLDFSDPAALSSYISNMSDHGHRLFNNCQTRYLLPFQPPAKLLKKHGQIGIDHLPFFDLIGTVENFDLFLHKLYKRMAWHDQVKTRRENVLSNKFGISTADESLLQAMKPLICADQIVYDYITKDHFNQRN